MTVSRNTGPAGASATGADPIQIEEPPDARSMSTGAPTPDLRRPGELWDLAAVEFVAWREGDPEGLNRLVRLVTPLLWHVARAYRLDQQTAEDVVQTTLVSLVRHAERIDEPQALVRWLTVTTRREAWRCARAARRVDATEDSVLDLRLDHAEGPESHVLRNHRDRALWRAVGLLPERCQRLLRTVAFSERPNYAELSDELRMPVGSIGPTRGRCLDKLRSLLGSDSDWRTA
jgi:RNA polymerase sigma factor (sigma-70 family)